MDALTSAARLSAQLLSGERAAGPVAVAERLLAVQGQDPRGFRLAIRSRTAGLTAAAVDRALTEDRSLLVSWLNRGTLHLVRREDYPWLRALTTPPILSTNARRLAQEGITADAAERGAAVIERSLLEDGPRTRFQLRGSLQGAGIRTTGQALVHLLMLACLRGIAVRGPILGREHAYVLVRDWIGQTLPPDRRQALAELARRYLAGHGPADDRDLAQWAGLPLRDARAGLMAISAEIVEGPAGVVDLAHRPPAAELPPPRLLGAFDPVLLGWRSRLPILGEKAHLVTVGGVFKPFAMVSGRAVATWRLQAGKVRMAPFEVLDEEVTGALSADAGDVERFLG